MQTNDKDTGGFDNITSNITGNEFKTFLCEHVLEFPYFSGSKQPWWVSMEQSWQEIVLINSAEEGASHPIHQHGGWYWVVGEGQFNTSTSIDRSYIKDLYEKGLLQQNYQGDNVTTVWNFPDKRQPLPPGIVSNFPIVPTDILPKDVIQVPNHGYVIIRTHLDNPGNFIFHCHIDFHLSIGMGLGKYLFFIYNPIINSATLQ